MLSFYSDLWDQVSPDSSYFLSSPALNKQYLPTIPKNALLLKLFNRNSQHCIYCLAECNSEVPITGSKLTRLIHMRVLIRKSWKVIKFRDYNAGNVHYAGSNLSYIPEMIDKW